MPHVMRGLTAFVADIRACTTREAERLRVEKELNKIRQKFLNTKALSGYDRKKYIWKLVYCHLLGFTVDFGQLEIVNLLSSQKYTEKQAGYLACSILLPEKVEILRLCVNVMKIDLKDPAPHISSLALNCISNLGTAEMAENLFNDVHSLCEESNGKVTPYIRRKAYLCLLKMYRNDVTYLNTELALPWIVEAFYQIKDVGCLISLCSLVIGILEKGTAGWEPILPAAIRCFSSVINNEVDPDYSYYSINAPWLQIKLLRLFQYFPPPKETALLENLRNFISSSLASGASEKNVAQGGDTNKQIRKEQENVSRSSTKNAVLFETLNLAIHMGSELPQELKVQAASLSSDFVTSREANIRCLGLETMARMADDPSVSSILKVHTATILLQLSEPDISIRRQSLNLLYAICDKDNWGYIVDELLESLKTSDILMQEELVLKIAILVEKNAPDFSWYVDVVFKMIEYAPDFIPDDIWYRVVQVVTGFDESTDSSELQVYAAQKAFDYLSDRHAHETMVKLGTYLLGEFGHHISEEATGLKQVDLLIRHYSRVKTSTKAIILLSLAKLANAHPDVMEEVQTMFREQKVSQDVDLQTRACEFSCLLQADDSTLEKTLAMMPSFSDSVRKNNPIFRRMKTVTGSRARKRVNVEETTDGQLEQEETLSDANDQETSQNNLVDITEAYEGKSDDEQNDTSQEELVQILPKPGTNDIRGMWKNACVTKTGLLYNTFVLRVVVSHEYENGAGRMCLTFENTNENTSILLKSATLQNVPSLRINIENDIDDVVLEPGASTEAVLNIQTLSPFLDPPKYIVEAVATRGEKTQALHLPFSLPIILTKFMSPVQLNASVFQRYWNDIGGPPKECVITAVVAIPPKYWSLVLTEAFKFYEQSIDGTMCGSGTFYTKTPNKNVPGKFMTVACMCKLSYDKDRNMGQCAVRAAVPQTSEILCRLLAVYLFQPSKSQESKKAAE